MSPSLDIYHDNWNEVSAGVRYYYGEDGKLTQIKASCYTVNTDSAQKVTKVTAGNTNMVKLYTMDVYVWYGKKDTNDIEAYIDASFESDSHFTVVTTIKEE